MLENKTIIISIAVIIFILILLSQTFLKKDDDKKDKNEKKEEIKENYIREDFPSPAMNVLYSDSSGNLSSTNDLGLQTLSLNGGGNWVPALAINSPVADSSLYSIYFGNGSNVHDQTNGQCGMGYISTNNNIGGKSNRTLATHIPSQNDITYYSSGWVPLFSVKGGTGNTYVKGNINTTGGKIQEGGHALIPKGMIMLWSGASNAIPGGWVLCDGENDTPDLRDRFVVGAGKAYKVKDDGGNDTIKLTVAQLPAHSHGMDAAGSHKHGITDPGHTHTYHRPGHIRDPHNNICDRGSNISCSDTSAWNVATGNSKTGISMDDNGSHTHGIHDTGSGSSIDIRPKYWALCYIMKT